MNNSRLTIIALLGAVIALGASQSAQAQVYGGIGYGYGHHGGFYSSYGAGYPYGGYVTPYRIAPGYAGSYSYGTTTVYGIGAPGYGTSYGIASPPPVMVAPSPVFGPSTTIIRGGPTGGVMQYSASGNGYTYVPDSNYSTVIQQQPTLGLTRTFVQQSPNPVVIESRPQGSTTYGLAGSSTPNLGNSRSLGTIKLSCPKNAPGGLNYSLNGHGYSIQPGYSQTIKEDRAWTLEFKRGGEGSEVARIPLKAGTYSFVLGSNGWDLQQAGDLATGDIPPAPLPDLSPIPSLSPSPSPAPSSSLPPSPLPPP